MAKKGRDLEQFFSMLLEKLGEFYEQKLNEGDLSSQDQKNLIQLLKDNNITIDPVSGEPLEGILNGDFSALEDVLGQRQ